MFCRHFEGSTLESVVSIIFINKTAIVNGKDQVVRHYAFKQNSMKFDVIFGMGFKYIHSLINQTSPYETTIRKFFTAYVENPINRRTSPIILSVDYSMFYQMSRNNQTYLEGDGSLIQIAQDITLFDDELTDQVYRVWDILLISDDNSNGKNSSYIAYAVREEGVQICSYDLYSIGNPEYYALDCNTSQAQNIAMNQMSVVALYRPEPLGMDARQKEPYFYGISVRPPAVIEFEMSDLENVKVNKVFKLDDPLDPYVGTYSVAANKLYVLHLLVDQETGRQAIRVFSRNSEYLSSAQFEIQINGFTVADYMGFPSHFLNYVVFRDERTVNLTQISDQRILFSGTNSSLVQMVKNQPIQVVLIAWNKYDNAQPQSFFVFFLDKYNTTIFPLYSQNSKISVFYNCGQKDWDYIVSDFVNGPNYNVAEVLPKRSKYFEFQNQGLTLLQEIQFEQEGCQVSFLFPYLPPSKEETHRRTHLPSVLVCIDPSKQTLVSYLLYEGLMNETNRINMPGTNLVDFSYDNDERVIFVVAEKPGYSVLDKEKIITTRYEMHVFRVDNQIMWVKNVRMSLSYNLTFFQYSKENKMCILIDYRNSSYKDKDTNMEIVRTFGFDMIDLEIGKIATLTSHNISYDQRLVKVTLAGPQAFYGMTNDKNLFAYHIEGKKIQRIRQIPIPDIINFDIVDGDENSYLIIYQGYNNILVYEIFKVQLEIQYKMRLPLYKDYENYKFMTFKDVNMPYQSMVRTSHEEVFSCLMIDPTTNKTGIFIYALVTNQHNAFILQKDLTSQFLESQKNPRLIAIGDEWSRQTIGVLSDKAIHLYEANYVNKLTLNEEALPQLKDKCRSIQGYNESSDEQKKKPIVKVIEDITIQPKSLFTIGDSTNISLNLTIVSQNQGLTISTNKEMRSSKVIVLQNDSYSKQGPFSLLHETYMQGQAMKFKAECSYEDVDGNRQDCQGNAVEESSDVTFSFPIDFVTSERRITRSFTLGNLYFMFDNYGNMIVNCLPYYSRTLDQIDHQPLEQLWIGQQQKELGCNITGFANYKQLPKDFESINGTRPYPDNSSFYLFIYHCSQDPVRTRMTLYGSIIIVFPFNETQKQEQRKKEKPFSVIRFENHIAEIPNEISDIQYVDLNLKSRENYYYPQIDVNIVVSCILEDTYSNYLMIFETLIAPYYEIGGDFLTSQKNKMISARSLERNTYMVTKLSVIRDTDYVVAVIEDRGIQILDLKRYMKEDNLRESEYVLAELIITEHLTFSEQLWRQFGNLKVTAVGIGVKNSLYVVTNYGLVSFVFNVDLTNSTMISRTENPFQVIKTRYIQVDFSYQNGEIIVNNYGNIFLMTRQLGPNFNETYLVANSYYSAYGSRLFKIISVIPNEKCYSLNSDRYFVDSPEDQIAVSFICNSFLWIHRVCMRPNIVIDFSNLTGLSVDPDNPQRGMFDVTMRGYNEFDDSGQNVTVTIYYESNKGQGASNVLFGIGAVVSSFILYGIILILSFKDPEKESRESMSTSTSNHQSFSSKMHESAQVLVVDDRVSQDISILIPRPIDLQAELALYKDIKKRATMQDKKMVGRPKFTLQTTSRPIYEEEPSIKFNAWGEKEQQEREEELAHQMTQQMPPKTTIQHDDDDLRMTRQLDETGDHNMSLLTS